jgi:hypothetical protein
MHFVFRRHADDEKFSPQCAFIKFEAYLEFLEPDDEGLVCSKGYEHIVVGGFLSGAPDEEAPRSAGFGVWG